MFAQRGLPDPAARIAGPLLALTGEQDIEVMRSAAVSLVLPLADRLLTVTAIAHSGHYPMQEAPPLLVAIISAS